MSKIGVAVTTRNRRETLDLFLKHFCKFSSVEDLVIVDDNSDTPLTNWNAEGLNVHYFYSPERLGIAGAKNKCLSELYRLGSTHFFLLDDDAFPQKAGWEDYYINTGLEAEIPHLTYNNKSWWIRRIESGPTIDIYNHSSGILLYYTKEILDTIGGFDTRFGWAGWEHIQHSRRAYLMCEQTKRKAIDPRYRNPFDNSINTAFFSPNNCTEYLYSLDIDFPKYRTPLMVDDIKVEASKAGKCTGKIMELVRDCEIYYPIVWGAK